MSNMYSQLGKWMTDYVSGWRERNRGPGSSQGASMMCEMLWSLCVPSLWIFPSVGFPSTTHAQAIICPVKFKPGGACGL